MTEDQKREAIRELPQLALDLAVNWDEGLMARAHYRDKLVDAMERAGLIDPQAKAF